MLEQILQALRKGKELFGQVLSLVTQEQRDLLVKIFPMLIATLVGGGYLLFRVPYRPLFSDLSIYDAASVVKELDAQKIPYRLLGNGTIIEVPSEILQRTRLEMAGKGLGSTGGVGFEIFEETSFGATDFTQRVNFLRALQGELSRTISNLDAIQVGRVHLGLPVRTGFLGSEVAPSASVVVGIRPGYRLSSEQVQGIANLVSNSVPRLVPARVTVVDTSGKLLQAGTGYLTGGLGNRYQVELGLEREMEGRIETMLRPVLGLNKLVTRVRVEVDFSRRELTRQEFDPSKRVMTSSQQDVDGSDTSIGGVPGVQGKLPGGDAEEPDETPTTKKSESVTYEIDRTTSRITEPGGQIRLLSIAVLIDGRYEKNKYIPRTPEEMEMFRTIIKRAVGFNEKRGDQLELTNARFRPEAELLEAVRPIVPEQPQQWVQSPLVIGIGAAVLLFLMFRLMRRRGRRAPQKQVALGPPQAQVLTEGEAREAIGETISGASEKLDKITITADPRKEQLAQIAKDYQDQTVSLIRMWLMEGKKPRPGVMEESAEEETGN